MKKINKVGIIIGIMITLVLSLTGCEFGKKNVNRTVINKTEVEGYTEYVHSSGIKFSYPTGWQSLGTTSKPVFGDTSTGTSVNYLSEEVPKTYNLTSYMSAAVANVKNSMQVVGDIEEEDVELNGRDASIIKYTVVQAGSNVVIKQACFLDDGVAHILTVATLESNYNEQAETIDNIVKSFIK